MLLLVAADGSLSTSDGAWLSGYGGLYLGALIVMVLRRSRDDRTPRENDQQRAGTRVAMLISGLVVIVVGSELLVDGAVDIARSLGVSDA